MDAVEDDDLSPYGTLNSKRGSRKPSKESTKSGGRELDGLSESFTIPTIASWHRRSIGMSASGRSPSFDVPAPTVLAELPRLTEIARVDGAKTTPVKSKGSVVCNAVHFFCSQ